MQAPIRRRRRLRRAPVASLAMDLERFCATSRVVIVAGKGGVGKTTVTAALVGCCSPGGNERADRRGRGQVGAGRLLRARAARLRRNAAAAGHRARTLTPDDALVEYLEDHGLRRISRRLAQLGRARGGRHRGPRDEGHPGAGQGQAARAGRCRRSDRDRRARRRARDQLPALGPGPARRGERRARSRSRPPTWSSCSPIRLAAR